MAYQSSHALNISEDPDISAQFSFRAMLGSQFVRLSRVPTMAQTAFQREALMPMPQDRTGHPFWSLDCPTVSIRTSPAAALALVSVRDMVHMAPYGTFHCYTGWR